jgi:hypothetical protein
MALIIRKTTNINILLSNSSKPAISKRNLFGYGAKELQNQLAKETSLETALNRKQIFEDMHKGKYGWLLSLTRTESARQVNGKVIYERIIAQGDRPEFLGSSLSPNFQTWVRLAFLHMWIVDVRFRYLENESERDKMTQPFYDWLWHDIECGLADTMDTANSMLITKHSKKFVTEWFGSALAYDCGMVTSDCSLAESLWRNLYLGNENVSLEELSKMVRYVRQQLSALSKLSDEDLLNANFELIPPPFEVPVGEEGKLRELEKKKLAGIIE